MDGSGAARIKTRRQTRKEDGDADAAMAPFSGPSRCRAIRGPEFRDPAIPIRGPLAIPRAAILFAARFRGQGVFAARHFAGPRARGQGVSRDSNSL